MIKFFVKNKREVNTWIGFHKSMLFGQDSLQGDITENKVLRNLLFEKTNSFSKFMGIHSVLQSDNNLLKTQNQKKGFNQILIKYLLESDDTYLDSVVHKPGE